MQRRAAVWLQAGPVHLGYMAAAVGILAIGSAGKSTPCGAALVVVAAPQRMRPKRKPPGERAELKISY
jgi:hypothetical protein